jgi:hypothetical protein
MAKSVTADLESLASDNGYTKGSTLVDTTIAASDKTILLLDCDSAFFSLCTLNMAILVAPVALQWGTLDHRIICRAHSISSLDPRSAPVSVVMIKLSFS